MKPENSSAALCAIALQGYKAAALAGQKLLAELGVEKQLTGTADHPALAWKRSGLFDLSGDADGIARMPPVDLTTVLDGAMLALKSLAGEPDRLPENASTLLGERARLMGLKRNGRACPGGSCRILDASDGRIALNLPRDDDWGLLEAWLEAPAPSWESIAKTVQMKPATELVQRGSELGLAVSLNALPEQKLWFDEHLFVPNKNNTHAPLVVDLSSLWAGPLASSLLSKMGANVVKVESQTRPDGARAGHAEFYNLLNAEKQSAAFQFSSQYDLARLRQLTEAADIVIEASRPRALRQLGIDAEALVAQKPGKLWLRLTAYGADTNRIGFGDDIGVAAGLSMLMGQAWGEPLFVGDAIADPIAGVIGALTSWVKWTSGGGRLINLSMRDTVRRVMEIPDGTDDLATTALAWQNIAEVDNHPLYPLRSASGQAEQLGKSTDEIMGSLC